MEAAQRDDREARMQLEQMSQAQDGDPAQLNDLLQKRKSADQSVAEMKQEFLSDISSFLTPQQVSRCSILLDELPHKVREIIREKERSREQGGGPMRRGGSPPRRRGY
jgi:Spy/CpxP family protein refolding chaperone